MYGTQSQCIGKVVLCQGASVSRLVCHPDLSQPHTKFQKKMRHALTRISPSYVDQVLNHHRFISRDRPKNCCRQPGRLRKCFQEIIHYYLNSLDFHDRFYAVIRGVQQNASQAQKVTRYLEIDDLTRPVSLSLVGTNPARGQNVGSLL